jgi:hypothetical protein
MTQPGKSPRRSERSRRMVQSSSPSARQRNKEISSSTDGLSPHNRPQQQPNLMSSPPPPPPPQPKMKRRTGPRAVTPTNYSKTHNRTRSAGSGAGAIATSPSVSVSASPSWEDYDEGPRSGMRGITRSSSSSSAPTPQHNKRPVVVSSFEDEDMPMDEMADITGTGTKSRPTNTQGGIIVPSTSFDSGSSKTLRPPMSPVVDAADRGGGFVGVQARNLQEGSVKEQELEIQLFAYKNRVAELEAGDNNNNMGAAHMQAQLQLAQEALRQAKNEHGQEVRAIQRVLADVTSERGEETEELNAKMKELTSQVELLQTTPAAARASANVNASASANAPLSPTRGMAASTLSVETVGKLQERAETADKLQVDLVELQYKLSKFRDQEVDKAKLKRDMDKKDRRLLVLERELKVAKTKNNSGNYNYKNEEDVSPTSKENEMFKKQLEEVTKQMEVELDKKEKQIQRLKHLSPSGSRAPPRPESAAADNVNDTDSVSSQEMESVQKNLTETVSSLENAKKIITSLENANSSLALDLRSKLKAKEEELTTVQNESIDRKRRLDSFATELRDLQKKQDDVEHMEKEGKIQLARQRALAVLLERGVSGLQSASVIHEVSSTTGSPDSANVDRISEILSDTLVAVKATLSAAEEFIDDNIDEQSIACTEMGGSVTSEVGRHIDTLIRNDREAAAKDLRNELDQKKAAFKRLEDTLNKQNIDVRRLRSEMEARNRGKEELHAEIRSLREQCTTNMEVLAKKERELFVLRSSLKVDHDDGGGYISDDASDGEDDGATQTEALVTLLSTGGSIDAPGRAGEMEVLKTDLIKLRTEKQRAENNLQMERESLANAKMIISSLEKANKSMMEDLRSRLQDSNTAIASLLDKSMEHEKTTATLREELNKVKNGKEEELQTHAEEVKKLTNESTVLRLRIEAKDRDLEKLQTQVGKLEKPVCVEEKKEETEGACAVAWI